MKNLKLATVRVIVCATVLCVHGYQPESADAQLTANSLAQLRSFGLSANNETVALSATGGDPHPVTGVVTPGHYWINGDHIANPANSEPIFMDLGGTGNTYNLSGATINVDTRKLDGFGRNLGHGSAVRLLQISGSQNTVQGISLIGHDLELDTDPNAQRYADWSTRYVEMLGDNNSVDGAHVVTRGSRTDTYGLGDAFGKGSSNGNAPFISHRKASAFRVGDATNAVVNDMHLEVNTFGHGFFVQTSTNTTLTNSTVTGEMFSSQGVVDRPEYQQHGHTFWGNPIADNIMISGAEAGVRMYTGSSGLTVDNVVVTNMRTAFGTALGSGNIVLNNVEAYGNESGFGIRGNTTITNGKGDIVNGPLVSSDRASSTTVVEVELVGGVPVGVDWAVANVAGSGADITITSELPASALPDGSLIRFGQADFQNWRNRDMPTSYEDGADPLTNASFNNNTNQMVVLGEDVTGLTGSSQAPIITNGKDNAYDGVSLVPTAKRTVLSHTAGLGNNGTAGDGSLESNASIVAAGGTLEIQPGIQISNEKLTISGDGADGKGALFSDGQTGTGTRFGSSNSSDESTIFLDGDASIGVGVEGNQLLLGHIQGTGNLTKRGEGILVIGKSSTFDGDLTIAQGHITARPGVVINNLNVHSGASISQIGNNGYNTEGGATVDGTLDLNGRSDETQLTGKVGALNGDGQIAASNSTAGSSGTLELAGNSTDGNFTGEIDGDVSLVKSGDNKQTLGGFMTHTGTTTISGGGLYIDGTHLGGGQYTVNDGGTLGGLGSIQANATLENGAALEPGDADGASQGLLTIGGSYSQAAGAVLGIDIEGTSNHDRLTAWGTTSLAGILDLNSTDPAQYSIGDTLTLLNSFSSVTGQFDSINGVSVGNVDGFGAGLAVQYNAQNVTAQVSIIGDADLDGQVDVLNDAFLLVGNLGTIAGATWADGDFNGDGAIDVLGDAFALVGNLGANANGSAAANSSAVPEPNSLILMIAMVMPGIASRRRK